MISLVVIGTALLPQQTAATPTFDIRPGELDGVDLNAPRARVGDRVFFVANDGTTGIELWQASNANGASLVKNINSVGLHSRPRHLTAVGDLLFFQADNGQNGVELWVSDGTEGGTNMVRDIVFGSGDANPLRLVDWNGTLWFTVGSALWKSDGTEGGTEEVWVGSGTFSTNIDMMPVGDTLFFAFNDNFAPFEQRTGHELWKTDGSESGTMLVADLSPGADSSSPYALTAFGNRLVFAASGYDGLNFVGAEPWITDGTDEGTLLIKDIYPGTPNSLTTIPGPGFSVIGSIFYFAANDGIKGNELWYSNGTPSGTMLALDIYDGPTSSNPNKLVVGGTAVYFRARGFLRPTNNEPEDDTKRDFGTELWWQGGMVDGSDWPNTGTRNPNYYVSDGGTLYFSAEGIDDPDGDGIGPQYGGELWQSSGGTSLLLADIVPGPVGSNPDVFAAGDGILVFSADEALTGREIYVLDAAPPAVLNLAVSPNPVAQNVDVLVTALATDEDRGGSNIITAEWSVNDVLFGDMSAVDGTFDSSAEDITATIAGVSLSPGDHEICVQARDGRGYDSRPACADITVEGDVPEMLVRCTHSPAWPQPGDDITIQVDAYDAFDGNGDPVEGIPSARSVDTLEVWVEDRTAPAFMQTNSTTASFNVGSFDEGLVAYGCRAIDNVDSADQAVFSGWRLVPVGSPDAFSAIRAVPVIYNTTFSNAVDVVFVGDDESYSGPTDPQFFADVEGGIREGFYGHGIHLRNQNRLNFWLAQDLGSASIVDGNCTLGEPTDWKTEYAFADVGAILHVPCMRDCASRTKRLFSVEGVNSPNVPCDFGGTPERVIRHEAGHQPFGLADEYCCDGGYFETPERPNLYDALSTCQADAPDLGRVAGDCRQFTEDMDRGGDTYSISEPDTDDDLMRFNGTPRAADVRRIQWLYDECLEGRCGGGPRCDIVDGTPSCSTSSEGSGFSARGVVPPIDPRIEPFPEFVEPILERGLALTVQFNTFTDAVAMGSEVTETDSPMNTGNPPLLRVESLDEQDNVIDSFTDWHPLWEHKQNEDGDEMLNFLESGTGTFIAPFHPNLASIRITDIELDMELLVADVNDVVETFCNNNPAELTCMLPPTTSTTSTTLPGSGGMCGDPTDDGAVTATDALFALTAAVGIQTCDVCLCDADMSGAVTASDALRILAAAVGQPVTLDCPGC